MKKKILITILIIIVLIMLILVIREIYLNYDKIENNNEEYTRDQVIELLDNGSKYNNYYRTVNTENGKEEFYYKDNILACYYDSKLKYWMNLTDGSRRMIFIDDYDSDSVGEVVDFENIIFPMENTQLGYYSTIYDTENFDFKYKGITKINDRDTLIVETDSKIDSSLKIKYYIDKQTGVIVKRTEFDKVLFLTKDKKEYDRGIMFDVVTDENIKEPDLTNVETYEINFPSLTIW